MRSVLNVFYRAVDRIMEPLAWVLFVGGFACVPLTWPCQVLPPFSDHPGNVLITCVAWLLVGLQGFDMLPDPE